MFCFSLTLNEIQDILELEADVLESEVVIIPNEGANSDADSGEEGEVDLSRLSRNQLLSRAEATVRKVVDGEIQTITVDVHDDSVEDMGNNVSALSEGKPSTSKPLKERPNR